MSSAVPRCSSSNGWPSDGSITGMVRPDVERWAALAMKCSCMRTFSSKAGGNSALRARHQGVLAAVLGQPAARLGCVLLARMEVRAQVLAPRAIGAANQSVRPEQETGGAAPGAPFPERALATQIVDGLPHHVA